ncbi:MAG: L-threonylcarbamoyladenylate synthase [Armatimonadota bacterium]|nr:L-threonylcarbamoyladenylate synthase [Armatimonadota bacterium]MCX7776658.1 L-threonylcarbamoyladenylate synthase [Armatimonadota bacterium]MDW8025727.1 L-threonylcarbamoyladenylate synthase [Armatimonadota bacterium]
MTKVIKADPNLTVEALTEALEEVAKALTEGSLAAFPTETVYGLGCNPFNRRAVERLYEIKGRPKGRPLPLLVLSPDQVDELATEISDAARKLMERFFPGALTLILRRSSKVPDEVCAYTDKVGVRCPKHNIPLALIKACGTPLATPSANLSGRISPTDAGEVIRQLGGQIEYVIDGGKTSIGIESTVIDMTVDPPKILRLGAIGVEEIETVIGKGVEIDEGAMTGRYRPIHARLILVDIDGREERIKALKERAANFMEAGCSVCLVVTDETMQALHTDEALSKALLLSLGSERNLEGIAASLYERIAFADKEKLDVVLVEAVPRHGIGAAIMQRLTSAAHEVIKVSGSE